MANHVIIMGAGASVSAGAPMMNGFLDLSRHLHAIGSLHKRESVFRIIGKLQMVHSKGNLDLVNLESVYNALEMARLIGGFADYSKEEIEQVINDYIQVIVDTIDASMGYPLDNGVVCAPSDYNQLAACIQGCHSNSGAKTTHDVSVISFNYDLGIDLALGTQGLSPQYCLEGDGGDGVKLLKLHGSMNWFKRESDQGILVEDVLKYANSYRGLAPRKADKFEFGFCKKMYAGQRDQGLSSGVPVIVPPTWNKSSLAGPISRVWSAARSVLSRADHIHIIGYSMPITDQYFSLLFSLGTVSDKTLSGVNIYNPDETEEFKYRMNGLFGPGAKARLKYFHQKFDMAIAEISKQFTRPV